MDDTSVQPVRGFQDVLPPDSSRMAALEALAREVFSLYGFGEIRLPTLENHALFVKTTGETTDIVEKEMFRLEDSGGRHLALRPEGTPGVVRAYLNAHLKQHGPVTKLFYVGGMFRAERPQAGRFREFEQIGVEALGNPHPAADVECILALKRLFDRSGLAGRTRLRLNNLGCDEDPGCRPAFRERLKECLKARAEELCPSCRGRIERNPLRALDCKADGPKLAAVAPKLSPCAACRDHVAEVSALLDSAGCEHAYPDPNLVRGLDYYTRTVFEFTAEGLGSQDAIAGGGRYDALVGSMGGPKTPAVGWALGAERTLLALKAADPALSCLMRDAPARGCDVFVAVAGAKAVEPAVRLLESLRGFRIRSGAAVFSSSLKAQLKEAARQGALYAVILGEDELAKQPPACALRDLSKGEQSLVPLSGVLEHLGEVLIRHGREP
ncbi:MAG: histidine--tRNA ligase [Elusimicrobiota bacterium]